MNERRVWAILATSIGTLMAMLDQAIANTALPTIAHDVNATAAASIWVINGYQLALVIGIVPLAAAGDIFGYKRLYLSGLALFVVASVACMFSTTLVLLTFARFIQGLAGAAMTVTAGPIVRLAFPPEMLGRATGYGAMAVAFGAAAGPIVSGFILALGPWQWLFAINIPIGLIAFTIAAYGVPGTAGTRGHFDWPSAALSIATFGLGVFGFDALGHHAAIPLAAGELVAAAIVGTLFIRRQLAMPLPMFAVDLFARVPFSLATFACYSSFIAQTIAYVALPFAFQTVMGHTPLQVGLLLLPWLLASALAAPLAGRLADRFNSSRLAAIGLGIFALGLMLVTLEPAHAQPADIVWRMAICGIGYGLFQSPNNRSIQASVPRERSAAPLAIQGIARLTGQTTGAIVVAIVFGLTSSPAHGSGTNAGAIVITLAIATACALAGALASAWRGVLTGSIRLRAA